MAVSSSIMAWINEYQSLHTRVAALSCTNKMGVVAYKRRKIAVLKVWQETNAPLRVRENLKPAY